MKKVIVYHSRDIDGAVSGAIVKKAHPEAELMGYDYGDPFSLPEGTTHLFMVDVSLPMAKMFDLANELRCFEWIDHHKSAIEEFNIWAEGDPDSILVEGATLRVGTAACELAWRHFFPRRPLPKAVELLGAYDAWRNDHPEWESRVLPFQYAMRLRGLDPSRFMDWVLIPEGDDHSKRIGEEVAIGQKIIAYQGAQDEIHSRNAFECNVEYFDGRKVKAICLNTTQFNSGAFMSVYDPEEHHLMIPFVYNGNLGRYKVSLYTTHDDVDCSLMAKRFGGGGHRKAAGFVVDDINNFLTL